MDKQRWLYTYSDIEAACGEYSIHSFGHYFFFPPLQEDSSKR